MRLKNLEEDLIYRINRAVAPELRRLRRKSGGDPHHARPTLTADYATESGQAESEPRFDRTSHDGQVSW